MTKTLTEQWREGTLAEGYYYILNKNGRVTTERTCFYSHTDEQCFCFTVNRDIDEVLAPVPSYDEWQSYDKCADMLIDVNKKWHKTIVENKKLKKQLAIATKALKGVSLWANTGNGGEKAVKKVCDKALKEMEGVK